EEYSKLPCLIDVVTPIGCKMAVGSQSWNWDYIFRNPNLNIDFVLNHKEEKFCWTDISMNPGIKMKDIENNLNLPWEWNFIFYNPNITLEFLFKYKNKFDNDKFWKIICQNEFKKEKEEYIEKNVNKINVISL